MLMCTFVGQQTGKALAGPELDRSRHRRTPFCRVTKGAGNRLWHARREPASPQVQPLSMFRLKSVTEEMPPGVCQYRGSRQDGVPRS